MTAGPRTMMIAGWLFVDLLLVLVLVQLGSAPAMSSRPDTPRTTRPIQPTTPTTADGSPAPPPPPALDPTSRHIMVHADAAGLVRGDAGARQSVIDQIVEQGNEFSGRRAAMILLFGSDGGIGPSIRYAAEAMPLFHVALPDMFPSDSAFYRTYFGGEAEGTVHAEIFFFTG